MTASGRTQVQDPLEARRLFLMQYFLSLENNGIENAHQKPQIHFLVFFHNYYYLDVSKQKCTYNL